MADDKSKRGSPDRDRMWSRVNSAQSDRCNAVGSRLIAEVRDLLELLVSPFPRSLDVIIRALTPSLVASGVHPSAAFGRRFRLRISTSASRVREHLQPR